MQEFDKIEAKKPILLSKIIDELNMSIVYLPEEADKILITSKKINRPGLHLIGFFDYFDEKRIQIFGKSELGYLSGLSVSERKVSLQNFLLHKPPVVIVTREMEIINDIFEVCREYKVPLLKILSDTSEFLSSIISLLNVELAPTITIPGGLLEVYGEGIMIMGESGIGKSETAIELMQRGHRLVADDLVEIKKLPNNSLIGSSPENIRHFLEIRGIGIVNAKQLFGLSSIRINKVIDLLVKLEKWNESKNYDRIGSVREYTEILGVKVPTMTIPIKSGRTISVIIEVAVLNHRQNKMGYSASEQLLRKLGYEDDLEDNKIDMSLDIEKIF